ncbi:MAG TPA: hypothetical protein VKB93_07195 [Thermoanaerobaculia bacterium]|nr:hypothetical protein [Thermoanaerobaculia bacterium]
MNILRTLALLLILLGPALYGQGPDADWRTIETKHFRVHYPREYEAWSMRAATRLESIREAVSKEVGFAPPQVVDVLIMNPIAQANGSAWPLLDTPRMIFFAEPPGPDEQLGAYGHWIDLLAVHEYAHTAHMLRPSRNPLERALLPLNPITLRAPRWVLEGYATVIEGRLTGAGRPTSTFRALLLRRWAESGRLPSYGELNSSQRFAGMSMAYLMGSAYLEWLEQRGSLRDLWARLTARRRRSFDEAFIGVFGERPDRLYGRFLAEVTASAIAIDRQRTLHEGELFQETPRASGEPAASPDGARLAIVIRAKEQPDKLVIWSTGAPEEEKKVDVRDPEDVPAIRTKPLPRKAVRSLTLRDGGDILTPRWTRDGKAIVFSHRARDAEGFLHLDLYRWDFESVRRITYDGDVHDADPYGDKAIAVRSRFGATQLVDVDLTTGAVTPRTEASIDVVYTHPRMSANGRLAYVAHREGRWTLFVDEKPVELPGDASSPEWMGESIVATVSRAGFAELYRDGELITITRGGAFDPAPSTDGRVFFMTLDPDGYILHVLSNPTPIPQPPPLDNALVPAIPPPPTQPAAFASEALTPSRKYGLGRQELSWFSGVNIARGLSSFEAGARLGDVVGRLDTLLMVGNEPRGVALASAWRGWPVELQAHLFRTDDDGLELRARWSRYRFAVEGGVLTNEFAFASASFTPRQVFGTWRLEEALHFAVEDDHQRVVAGAAIRGGSLRIAARVQHDRGDELILGGLPSSLLPRSAYARHVLDPALPVAALAGSDYDGWRVEAKVPSLPFTAFYQRHELGGARISVRGLEAQLRTDPFPILKLPAVDVTAGVAQTGSDTNWWLGMRWHP